MIDGEATDAVPATVPTTVDGAADSDTASEASEASTPAWRPWRVGVVTWLIGAAWFFRDPLTSGFDTITGDRGDARLVIFLHEHWWRVWHGDASWRSPDMFFPAEGTLGYSDTFVLNQIVYAPLRFVGFDQFVAFQLTLIALTAVGFASLFTLLHRYVGVALVPTCLLSAVGVFANNVFVDTGHPQIYSISVMALIVLVFVASWQSPSLRRRHLGAFGGGVSVGLLLWTAYYFGWFLVFFGGLTILLTGAIGWIANGRAAVIAVVADRWRMAMAAIAGLAVGVIPFLATYLPVLDDSDPRTYDQVAELAPRPLDLVNVGRHNVAWGWLVRPLLDHDARLDTLYRAAAPTPVLLVVTGIATVTLAIRLRRGTLPAVGVIGLATCLVTWFALLMPVQFEFGGAWAWVHRFVPGASALRLYSRSEVVASVMACLSIGAWLRLRHDDRTTVGERPGRDGSSRRDRLVVGVLMLIAFEQANTTDGFRQFDRPEELALLDASRDAPACDAFYVTDRELRGTDHSLISAMLIAHEIDTPTLNGYSGQTPPGWDLKPWYGNYDELVGAWVSDRLPGRRVCALELTTLRWSVVAGSGADRVDQ
jgi:hypothetical protein